MMNSSGDSSLTSKSAENFESLLRQLNECHQNTLQELEAKVSKLKKDRCLDAQRLEVFYNRNQQLKEQNKTLQETIGLLEERLRSRACERCAILEGNLKSSQDQNLQLLTQKTLAESQRNNLCEENQKLQFELRKLKLSCSEPNEAPPPEEDDEGVIPDSPTMPSSLPTASRLKKQKHSEKTKRVCYAETPLFANSLFREMNKDSPGAAKTSGREEVLVANTCELEPLQILDENMEEVVAETCAFDLLSKPLLKKESSINQQSSLKCPGKQSVSFSLDSQSLLPIASRLSLSSRSKRRREEGNEGRKEAERTKEREEFQPEIIHTNQGDKEKDLEANNQAVQTEEESSSASPAFKKPHSKLKTVRKNLQETEQSERRNSVQPMWSMDPALALSMSDSQQREEEEELEHPADLLDTDCTWVSHSMLQRGRDAKAGLGEKACDSLDMMFDTTAHGEYKSFNDSHSETEQSADEEEEKVEEEKEEEDCEDEDDFRESLPHHSKAQNRPTFAHVAVVRKKDERRKLHGTTCKECDVYYAHLPDGEKQKKLSACSRHRYLYIPPSTPENFWEVGFPSTQTCIERGYIKEEKKPQSRLRRRQPLTVLFSPKRSQKKT